jgi:cbb3-type cytochrome oxidase subunit 1
MQDYNYKVVRQFAIMTVVWGIVGMLVGVVIAAQLAWPALNPDVPWLHFGRGCVKSLIHPTNRVCMYLSRHPDRSPQAFFADIVG